MEFDYFLGKEVTLVGYIENITLSNGSVIIVEFLHNNKTYILKASGNNDDGYRSYIDDISLISNKDVDYKNHTFIHLPPAKVKIIHIDSESYESYGFTDEFKHTWVSFGTNNKDDYYPYYFLNVEDIDLKSWREAKLNDIL